AHPERPRALDVVLERVADHRRVRRLDAEPLERGAEDRLVRLDPAVLARADGGVDVEPVVEHEVVEVADAVRDEREGEAEPAELLEDRQRVLVEVEVVVLLPRALDRDGALAGALAVAAHAADDPLGERDPDLLVVPELRMPLERLDGRGPRLLITGRIEAQPELLAAAAVARRAELGARPHEREVDVEEDGAERHGAASSSQRA